MPPSVPLAPVFDPVQVATSIVIAIVASYAALAVSTLVRARVGTARLPWLIAGGFAVGLGIAGMHFVGMLAMHLPVPVTYDIARTVFSFVVAIVASIAALTAARRESPRASQMLLAAAALGTAVAGMHYIGMDAMRGPFEMHHDGARVLLSIVIAFAAAAAAFWLAHRLRDASGWRGASYRLASAAVMGCAIAGMHYTAMSAVTFTRAPSMTMSGGVMVGREVVDLVTVVGLVLLSATIFVALLEQRARRIVREAATTNERYREMADAMPQIVWTARADGRLDYLNRRWTEYTGQSFDPVAAPTWAAAIHADERPLVLSTWSTAVENGAPLEIEYRLQSAADGDYRWHLGRAVPLRDDDGAVIKWFGTCTDIHEQKLAQSYLRAHQVLLENRIEEREAEAERATALYQLLAENATDMVSTHRPDGCFDYATPSWLEFLGTSPLGKMPATFSHHDDVELLIANHRLGFSATQPITTVWRGRRRNGEYGWLETRTRAVRDAATDRVVTFVCATRDITQSKDAELALRESEDKYRELVEEAADAILLVDSDGRCAGANARTGMLMGLDPDSLVGRPLDSFLTPARGRAAEQAPRGLAGAIVTAEFELRRADGTTLPVEANATSLANGRVQIIARDISARKELERLKDQFISVVSHELRTPLTSIRGSLGLLASGQLAAAPEKAQRMLSVAVTNTDRLIRLINDILDVERLDSGAVATELSWCDPREITAQVLETLRPLAEHAGITLAASGNSAPLWADADRITQTITNLVGNAVKFSPAGSSVEIRLDANDREVVVAVRDRGRGIPPSKLETIFDRFQQVDASDAREKGGTGLGLAISRSIVAQHGGRIWAANNAEGGCTFTFTLPRRHAEARLAAPAPAGDDRRALRQLRVLVIEDDVELANVIATSLEARGFRVDVAHDGAAALDRHTTSAADLFVVDLSLPDISGLDLIDRMHEARGAGARQTIIYTATDPSPAARERIRQLGAEIATKGRVSTQELVDRVVRTLGTPRRQQRVA